VTKKIEYLSVKELRESGLLHEINRTFLHPLGLALQTEFSDNPATKAKLKIQDWRKDPEGVRFSESALSSKKAAAFRKFSKERTAIREAQLGYICQPIEEELKLKK